MNSKHLFRPLLFYRYIVCLHNKPCTTYYGYIPLSPEFTALRQNGCPGDEKK